MPYLGDQEPHLTAKLGEIWDPWVVVGQICCTFDLLTFNAILEPFGAFVIFPKIHFKELLLLHS